MPPPVDGRSEVDGGAVVPDVKSPAVACEMPRTPEYTPVQFGEEENSAEKIPRGRRRG